MLWGSLGFGACVKTILNNGSVSWHMLELVIRPMPLAAQPTKCRQARIVFGKGMQGLEFSFASHTEDVA